MIFEILKRAYPWLEPFLPKTGNPCLDAVIDLVVVALLCLAV